MGSYILILLKWVEANSRWLLIGALAIIGGINYRRWVVDRKAAVKLRQALIADSEFSYTPLLSFLVPAWNEAGNIPAFIESVLSLRYPAKELIICAGGSDKTFRIAKNYSERGIIVLEQHLGEGKQGALRRCFEHSNGDVLFLTDADCIVNDACVEATLSPLLLEDEAVATGYWQPFESDKEHPFVRYQWANHLRYQAGMPNYVESLDGRNCAISRDALIAAGSFRNEAAIGTDYVLSQKLKSAGFRIRSVLASRVQTEYPLDIPAYLQQGSRWYRNRLVQGVKFKQWRDVMISLWGSGASLFMFIGPLAIWLHLQIIGVIWMISTFHLVSSSARLAGFFMFSGFGQRRYLWYLIEFIIYILVNDMVMIRGLLESLSLKKQKVW